MQKKCILLFILFCCHVILHAQYENVWVFGNRGGLDFSNGSPAFLTTTIYGNAEWTARNGIRYLEGQTSEAEASVCDTNGKFLFFTGGQTVWNRNYDTMFNGSRLLPDSVVSFFGSPTSSTSQGALIVPMPGSSSKYYIFSLTSSDGQPRKKGYLYYSVVDMNLNNGLGGVDPKQKTIFLDSGLQEKMTSVVGDQCNVWVLTSGYDGRFRAYEITASGIGAKPVISSVGMGNRAAPQGMIAVSSDRKKIASVQAHAAFLNTYPNEIYSDAAVALFDFNASSGMVSTPITLLSYVGGPSRIPGDYTGYSVCFSPDNSKLYYASVTSKISQFDLSSGDSATMAKSFYFLGSSGVSLTQMKLAPDEKIYFTMQNSNSLPNRIGRIGSPNLAGAACQFLDSVFVMAPDVVIQGLPNVISVLKADTTYGIQNSSECSQVNITAKDTTGWDYIWNDGGYGTKRSVDTSGTFWVEYHTPPCVFHMDTFVVTIWDLPAPVITVKGFDLSVIGRYGSYQWYLNGNIIEGATDSTYAVTENGDYTVGVSDLNTGCTKTSAIYKVTNVTGIKSIGSRKLDIRIYPNPVTDVMHIYAPVPVEVTLSGVDGRSLKVKTNNGTINTKALAGGMYLVRIYNLEGLLLKVEKIIFVK